MNDHSTDPWRFETLENPGVYMLEANAGAGKTHALTSLCTHLLETGKLRVEQVLMVTFTRAAAAELQQRTEQRIRERLHELAQEEHADESAQRLLQKALEHLDEATICTIDGFYHRIFSEYAYELGVSHNMSAAKGNRDNLERACRLWWRRNGRTTTQSALCAAPLSGGAIQAPETLAKSLEKWRQDCGGYLEFMPLDAEFAALPLGWDVDVFDLLQPMMAKIQRSDALGSSHATLQVLRMLEDPAGLALSAADLRRCRRNLLRTLSEPSAQEVQEALIEVDGAVRDLERAQLAQGAQPSFADLPTWLHEQLSRPSSRSLRHRLRQRWRAVLVDESQDNNHMQFDLFKSIFGPEEGRKNHNLLLYIGDPKQAIFSWRGGDLHSWVQTRDETDTDHRVSPPDNWRSRPKQVAAVNAIFSRNEYGFEAGDIAGDYQPSRAAAGAEPLSLQLQGSELDGLHLEVVGVGDPDDDPMTKLVQRQSIACHCAQKIATLLQQGQEGRALLVNASESRPLEARDIAVLTRSNNEATLMRRALNAIDLDSVVRESQPVLGTSEAFWLLTLMRALAAPENYRLLRAALATPLLNLIPDIKDESALQRWAEIFHNSHLMWKRRGFYPAMMQLLAQTQMAQRLVLQSAGQRSLTNLFHLLELMAQEEDRNNPPSAMVYRLEALMQEQKRDEEYELRLETDEDMVQIATVHKAKGLEFPVVFLPFVWGAEGSRSGAVKMPQIARDERGRRRLNLNPHHRHTAEGNSVYEDIRLLYVALTRAVSHTQMLLRGNPMEVEDSGILGNILFRGPGSWAPWKELAADEDNGISLSRVEVPPMTDIISEISSPRHSGRADTFDNTVTQSWQISSYSSIVAQEGGHSASERSEQPDHDQSSDAEIAGDLATASEADGTSSQLVQPQGLTQPQALQNSIFTFPKGAEVGLFFHQMLEWMVRQDSWGDDPEALTHACQNALKNRQLPEQLAAIASGALQQVAGAHLPAADHCLKEVADSQRAGAQSQLCSELEFEFPLAPGWQNALRVAGFAPGAGALQLQPGFMKGFIDLVWVHEGRYWLADLKSNWLGPTPASYRQAELHRAAEEHAYRLQLSLYSLALHRHLQTHLADYDYERHFGGSFLLFLRAMEAGRDSGVWHHRLPLAELQKLDSGISGSNQSNQSNGDGS